MDGPDGHILRAMKITADQCGPVVGDVAYWFHDLGNKIASECEPNLDRTLVLRHLSQAQDHAIESLKKGKDDG